ncbi:YihY/virulence factor BrkB family protein [Streptacidiphilus sp. EB103A]|uniref:YihY/virulence factor BrkB family protein n=1 Tax=Streptacidiphilus sp. EB103A TaxID=3156275 RepID=UPI00351278B9
MQPAGETPSPKARHRARPSRRAAGRRAGAPYRSIAWQLVKDTTNTCMEYRVTGLAAEVAFFTLMSVPPLLLCVAGTLGYLSANTIKVLEQDILNAASTVLSPSSIDQTVKPLLNSVFSAGRPDLISIGFMLALWSGSRALYVFVETVTIMYGLEGKRGIIHTRMLSLGLYIVALIVSTIVLPLVVAGPGQVVDAFPQSAGLVHALYWPGAMVLSVVFLTTLYHVAVPVRTPWKEDLPGALVALLVLVLGSGILRFYLVNAVEGPTVYGSLAAPVAVLLWIGVTALAVLVGAAMNAAIDRMWPSRETAMARAENERAREEAAAELVRRAEARRAAVRNKAANPPPEGEEAEGEAPSEYPERWADFLAPTNLRDRIQSRGIRRRNPYPPPEDPKDRRRRGGWERGRRD